MDTLKHVMCHFNVARVSNQCRVTASEKQNEQGRSWRHFHFWKGANAKFADFPLPTIAFPTVLEAPWILVSCFGGRGRDLEVATRGWRWGKMHVVQADQRPSSTCPITSPLWPYPVSELGWPRICQPFRHNTRSRGHFFLCQSPLLELVPSLGQPQLSTGLHKASYPPLMMWPFASNIDVKLC